jgi:hypothetical protein
LWIWPLVHWLKGCEKLCAPSFRRKWSFDINSTIKKVCLRLLFMQAVSALQCVFEVLRGHSNNTWHSLRGDGYGTVLPNDKNEGRGLSKCHLTFFQNFWDLFFILYLFSKDIETLFLKKLKCHTTPEEEEFGGMSQNDT